MDEDELDFGTTKSRSARQGRRAAPAAPAGDVDQDDDDDLGTGTNPASGGGPPDRPNKAVSGWGEEAPRKPRSRQLGEGFEALEDQAADPQSSKQNKGAWDPVEDIDQELDDFDLLFGLGTDFSGGHSPDLFRERLRPSSPAKDDSDSDNDIPVIPELEDQAEEDMSSRVATAPNVAVNRVATYRELDNDLLRQAAFQVLDNEIDLKLLTKSLSPMEDLIEEDRPWDWDRLFTEVSSVLTTQWEKGAEEGETEKAET